MILKLGMQHRDLKLYKVCINDDNLVDLDGQIGSLLLLNGGKCYKFIYWKKQQLATKDYID